MIGCDSEYHELCKPTTCRGDVMITYAKKGVGRTKVFFVVDEKGNVSGKKVGNQVVSVEQGFQFYVDDYVAEQIDKFELIIDGFTPKLVLKEGETLFVPEECDEYKKQKEIEELERKLKELKGDAK